MKRERRIRVALRSIKRIENSKIWKDMNKRLTQAVADLKDAEISFDPGEKVKVVITCQRGCCVDDEYFGKVKCRNKNRDFYTVEKSDGSVNISVYYGDMRRV